MRKAPDPGKVFAKNGGKGQATCRIGYDRFLILLTRGAFWDVAHQIAIEALRVLS